MDSYQIYQTTKNFKSAKERADLNLDRIHLKQYRVDNS